MAFRVMTGFLDRYDRFRVEDDFVFVFMEREFPEHGSLTPNFLYNFDLDGRKFSYVQYKWDARLSPYHCPWSKYRQYLYWNFLFFVLPFSHFKIYGLLIMPYSLHRLALGLALGGDTLLVLGHKITIFVNAMITAPHDMSAHSFTILRALESLRLEGVQGFIDNLDVSLGCSECGLKRICVAACNQPNSHSSAYISWTMRQTRIIRIRVGVLLWVCMKDGSALNAFRLSFSLTITHIGLSH